MLPAVLAQLFLAALADATHNASETLAVFYVTRHHTTLHSHAIEDDRVWATALTVGAVLTLGLGVFLCVRVQ